MTMSRVIFVAQTDETRRKEALAQLDEIMVEIRERAAQLLEVMREDVLTCLEDTHRQVALDLGECRVEEELSEAWPEARADETDQQLCVADLEERLHEAAYEKRIGADQLPTERMAFNHWWNEGLVAPGNNPYRHESAAWWAWEGWQAAICARG
jgi:hypothetical protein